MDGPEGTALGSNDALLLRLRKAHLHVQSVTSWEVGRHVLHGMAADIRAAQEQLDPLVVPKLTDRDQAKLSGNRGRYTSERDRALKVYCHPRAVSLTFEPDQGGLGTNSVPELVQLVPLLGELVTAYCLALGTMADALGHSSQSNIVSTFQRARGLLASVPPAELRPFLGHGERGEVATERLPISRWRSGCGSGGSGSVDFQRQRRIGRVLRH